MINVFYFEDDEWRSLELKADGSTNDGLLEIIERPRRPGSPVLFLEHPGNLYLLALHSTSSIIYDRLTDDRLSERQKYEQVGRIIDSFCGTSSARLHLTNSFDLALSELRLLELEAEVSRSQEELRALHKSKPRK